MKSLQQLFVIIFTTQYVLITSKPIFKGLSLKKNYEMEISAIPFKHISFIKEKWFPFKMIGFKHDIAKRQVNENLYSVNEVSFDNEEGKYPGLLTSVKQNLDLNSEGEIIRNPAPVFENAEAINVSPITEQKNVASGILHTSIMPVNPSIIIAPSIQTTGSVVQPAAVVPVSPEVVVSPVPTVPEVVPVVPASEESVKPIQPLHTYVDVEAIQKPIESSSIMHTDISSVVPLNTLVASPVQEMDVPLPVDVVKVEAPVVQAPKVVEEIKVEPPVAPPTLEIPPVVEVPIPESPGKTGPPGLFMRGTRFVLYFGSVMLQLLSQMLTNPPNLNQFVETLTLQ
ncbi:uncharacterized protein [Epargyreus clarus]|uniref:uncharacterized protein n=1 Tax=Epargyreus clarus TaxID=520877 RepID=UPI003C2F1420